jgi:hypothetical protein
MSILLYDFSVTPPKYVDRHAVAITGFSLGHPAPIPIGSNSFLTKASRINELYAHDDQVGPFARMVLNQGITDIEINGDIKPVDTVSTSLGGGHLKAVPDTLLIPLYHKIRISFNSIQHVVSHLDNLLEIIRINGVFSIPGPIEWDIRLTETNKLKEDIFSCTHLNNDIKQDVLLSSLPRFIWRATGCANNAPLLDLIFDATDIEQGLSLTRAIRYNDDIYDCLTVVSKYPGFKTEPVWKILKWFSNL